MIRSEDKIIEFVLMQDVDKYDPAVYYMAGDYAYVDKVFYQCNTDNTRNKPVSGAEWDNRGNVAPVIDIQNTILGITLFLFTQSGKILDMYSMNTLAGHKPIYTDPARLGLMWIELPRSVSINLEEKKLLAEIKVLFNTTTFSTNKMNTIIHEVEINPSLDSILRNTNVQE